MTQRPRISILSKSAKKKSPNEDSVTSVTAKFRIQGLASEQSRAAIVSHFIVSNKIYFHWQVISFATTRIHVLPCHPLLYIFHFLKPRLSLSMGQVQSDDTKKLSSGFIAESQLRGGTSTQKHSGDYHLQLKT